MSEDMNTLSPEPDAPGDSVTTIFDSFSQKDIIDNYTISEYSCHDVFQELLNQGDAKDPAVLARRTCLSAYLLKSALAYQATQHDLPAEAGNLQAVTDIALSLYDPDFQFTEAKRQEFLARLDPEFQEFNSFTQIIDETTIESCQPEYMKRAITRAESLLADKEQPTVVTLFANGGILSGLEFYRLLKQRKSNCMLLPLKYSVQKSKDVHPKLTSYERQTVEEILQNQGGNLLIYDEDYATGKTIAQAGRWFSTTFNIQPHNLNLVAAHVLNAVTAEEYTRLLDNAKADILSEDNGPSRRSSRKLNY
jgi:hypoxanthine phosphoribosyltransferase